MALFLLLHFEESDAVAGCSLVERGGACALRQHGLHLAESLNKDPSKILDYNIARRLPARAKYSLVLASDQDIAAWTTCTTHAAKIAWWQQCQARGLVRDTVYEDVLICKAA